MLLMLVLIDGRDGTTNSSGDGDGDGNTSRKDVGCSSLPDASKANHGGKHAIV